MIVQDQQFSTPLADNLYEQHICSHTKQISWPMNYARSQRTRSQNVYLLQEYVYFFAMKYSYYTEFTLTLRHARIHRSMLQALQWSDPNQGALPIISETVCNRGSQDSKSFVES
jgi:hypothetical protein